MTLTHLIVGSVICSLSEIFQKFKNEKLEFKKQGDIKMKKQVVLKYAKMTGEFFTEMMIKEQSIQKDDLCTLCWKPIEGNYCECCNKFKVERNNDEFLNIGNYMAYA